MKRDEAFPSNYLKAADIPDEGRILTVKDVEEEEFKNDGKAESKLIVYFRESEKGLVLNKTNGNTMFDLCGDDTDDWPGKRVKLVSGVTTYQGRTVDCIRVSTKPVLQKPGKATRPPADEDDPEDSAPEDSAPEGSAPRSGKALFAWTKDMEQRHGVGLLKYVNGWAKLQDFPGRMVDWNAEQVSQAHAECVRKLQSIGNPVPVAAGGEDDDVPF